MLPSPWFGPPPTPRCTGGGAYTERGAPTRSTPERGRPPYRGSPKASIGWCWRSSAKLPSRGSLLEAGLSRPPEWRPCRLSIVPKHGLVRGHTKARRSRPTESTWGSRGGPKGRCSRGGPKGRCSRGGPKGRCSRGGPKGRCSRGGPKGRSSRRTAELEVVRSWLRLGRTRSELEAGTGGGCSRRSSPKGGVAVGAAPKAGAAAGAAPNTGAATGAAPNAGCAATGAAPNWKPAELAGAGESESPNTLGSSPRLHLEAVGGGAAPKVAGAGLLVAPPNWKGAGSTAGAAAAPPLLPNVNAGAAGRIASAPPPNTKAGFSEAAALGTTLEEPNTRGAADSAGLSSGLATSAVPPNTNPVEGGTVASSLGATEGVAPNVNAGVVVVSHLSRRLGGGCEREGRLVCRIS